MKETKRARFKRIAEARVNKIIDMLRLLGNCSFTGTYEYDDDQIDNIFHELQIKLNQTKDLFKRSRRNKNRFSLSEADNTNICEFPTVILPLPDGTRLRAFVVNDNSFPAINLWVLSNSSAEEKSVCFVEFNSLHEKGKELCMGVCNSKSDDPYFYAEYNSDEQDKK